MIPGWGRPPGEGNDWLPTPLFLPGKFHGQRSLVGYGPWGCTESNVTERRTLVEEPDTTAHARTHTHTHTWNLKYGTNGPI